MEEIKEKKDAESLQKYMKSLPIEENREKKQKIIKECMISKKKFDNWYYGLSRIEPIYKCIIETIADKNIFDEESND